MAGTQDHHVDESDRVYADLRGSRSLGDHVCGISSIDIRPYLHNGLIRSLQPSFWVAELLRELFMQKWLWSYFGFESSPLPILGLKSQNFDSMTSFEQFVDYGKHLVLPVLCLTYGGLAYVSRQMRAGMLEVIRQDYIRTAEAKGCGKGRVILVHALRNSLFPIITLLASLLPFLVGGSVIIEVIFNIHGMGLLSYEGVLRREYDLVMTTLMLSAILTLVGILVSDILYVVVNPRVSFDDK